MSQRIQPGNIPPHYALTDKTRMELDFLFQAMETIYEMAAHPIEGPGPYLAQKDFAPVFAVFAGYGKRLLAEAPFIGTNGRVIYDEPGAA